jgi:hypothetical protein
LLNALQDYVVNQLIDKILSKNVPSKKQKFGAFSNKCPFIRRENWRGGIFHHHGNG